MARISRSYETDLDDLSYQISKSDAFSEIRAMLQRGEIDDQEAQERLLNLILDGRTGTYGDRGPEDLSWKLTEAESGRLTSLLYVQYLGAD